MSYSIVGAFVLVLGAVLIAGVLWLASGGAWQKKYELYLAIEDESVAGLNLNAPVKYNGVDVGKVRKIELDTVNPNRVNLLFAIEQGTPVKEDTIAVLKTQGLTGIAYVELTGGHRDSPPLEAQAGEAYPVIPSAPSLMVRLDSAISTLLTNVNGTSANLGALLDENNRREFRETLMDLRILSRTLAARSAAIDSGLANAARTMDNAARLSVELPRLAEHLQKSADRFDRMTDDVSRASASVSGTVEGARNDLRQATRETLPEVRLLASELREVTASLRSFSQQLEQNPSVLLYGKPISKPGPGE